ncbi:MAG: LVIVD repeat-containing protein, partial [Anaerolineae bacterium]
MQIKPPLLRLLAVASLLLFVIPSSPAASGPQTPADPFGTPRALDAASSGASDVVLVGQLGGASVAVDVAGTLVYAGVGPRLAILDVSKPSSPRLLGQTAPMPRVLEAVTVDGGLAYVAAGDAGLRVVDVSDPAAPVEIGFLDTAGYAWDVAVAGSHAYIADGAGGLRVVNMLDPAHPAEQGAYEDPAMEGMGVAVAGGYAYLADAGDGLRAVNVTDPAAPVEDGLL